MFLEIQPDDSLSSEGLSGRGVGKEVGPNGLQGASATRLEMVGQINLAEPAFAKQSMNKIFIANDVTLLECRVRRSLMRDGPWSPLLVKRSLSRFTDGSV